MYYGDIRLGDTIDIKFTTRQISGAPFTLAGSPVISAYVGNGTTEITAGITLSVDFDARTGLNNVRVVASSGNGFATATNVQLVITTGTVNSVSVVGEVIGSFSIEARSAIMPTTAARTLDVSATGEAGLDFANIGAPAAGAVPVLGMVDNGTAQAATGTTLQLRAAAAFASSEIIGSIIVITGGTTGVGQVRQITAYNGGTDTATVDTWTTTPTGTITYTIFAAPPAATGTLPAVNVTQWNGSAVSVPTVAGVPNVNAKTWNDLATVALPLVPTTAGRTLDVSATGEAGLDWANIGSPTTAVNLSATNIDVDQVVASVSGAVGSVTGLTASDVGAIKAKTDNLPTDPADESLIIAATDAIMTRIGAPAGASVSADVAAVKVDTAAIKTKTDLLPAVAAGAANGLPINGANTGPVSYSGGVTISNAAGDALALTSSGGNGHGLAITADGTGDGISTTGGATGRGIHALGGATSGAGIRAEAQAGANSNGMSLVGSGTGDGLMATGGATGHGMHALGGATSGAGMVAEGQAGNANGLECIANGSGIDLAADNITAIKTVTDKLDTTLQVQTGSEYQFTANALALAPSGTGPTLTEIVDGVWDEPIAGHLGAGSTGAALNGAGSAGDPWTTPLPGAYGAGTAGFIVGTNLDAQVSAVKAKTDNLPTDPADESLVIAATDAIFNRIGAPAGASVSADIAAVNAKTTNLPTDPADESLVIAATDAIFNRIGAPAGASVSADIAAVNAKTTNLPTDPADESLIIAATDAIMTRLGAPAGASVSADIAGVQSDTNDIQGRLPAALVGGRIDASTGAMAANVLTAAAAAADFTTEIQAGLATAAALTTVGGNVTAVKAKTDSLAFTVAGQLDANVQYVNDTQVQGNGQPGTEWGPV